MTTSIFTLTSHFNTLFDLSREHRVQCSYLLCHCSISCVTLLCPWCHTFFILSMLFIIKYAGWSIKCLFSNRTSRWGLWPGILVSLHCNCCKMGALVLALCPRYERPHDIPGESLRNPCCPQTTTTGSGNAHRSRHILSDPGVLIYLFYGSIDCLLKYHVPNLTQFPADMQACEWKNRMLSAATLSNVNVATVVKGVDWMARVSGRNAATESVETLRTNRGGRIWHNLHASSEMLSRK